MAGLVVKEGALVADNDTLRGHMAFTSGGLEQIVPENYDLVVIYGLRFLLDFSVGAGTFSCAVTTASHRDFVSKSLSVDTLRKLRGISDVPCIVGATPPSISTDPSAPPLDAETLATVEKALQTPILDPLNAVLLGPPLKALVWPMNSDPRFSQEAIRLAVGDKHDLAQIAERNNRHMNADYGRLWLEALFDRN